jgi:hypothetical protein
MIDRRYRLQPVKPLSQFRKAIQLFNDEYKPRINKAEARRRVRQIYPHFV